MLARDRLRALSMSVTSAYASRAEKMRTVTSAKRKLSMRGPHILENVNMQLPENLKQLTQADSGAMEVQLAHERTTYFKDCKHTSARKLEICTHVCLH